MLFWLATCILPQAEDRAYGPSKGYQNKYDRSVQSSYQMNSNDAISKMKCVHIIKIQMTKKSPTLYPSLNYLSILQLQLLPLAQGHYFIWGMTLHVNRQVNKTKKGHCGPYLKATANHNTSFPRI